MNCKDIKFGTYDCAHNIIDFYKKVLLLIYGRVVGETKIAYGYISKYESDVIKNETTSIN